MRDQNYLNSTRKEKELSKIYGLLDELKTGKLPDNYGDGYDERVYNRGHDENHFKRKEQQLIRELMTIDVTKYSLELQMWWRDYNIKNTKP